MVQQGTARRMAAELPIGRDPASVARRVEVLEKLLERSFVIPGTRIPVGLDAIAGLIPVAGDLISAALGLYLVWEGRNLGMTKFQQLRMVGNVGLDTLIGAVPVAGDLLDFFYRSNSKNLRIIRRHLKKHHPGVSLIEG
jgi:Domain of unknown function (DUF4112)